MLFPIYSVVGFFLCLLCIYTSTPFFSPKVGTRLSPLWGHLWIFLINTKRPVILIISPRFRSQSICQTIIDLRVFIKNICYKKGARYVSAVLTPWQDLDSIPRTHMTSYNLCNSTVRRFDASLDLQRQQIHSWHRCTDQANSYTLK